MPPSQRQRGAFWSDLGDAYLHSGFPAPLGTAHRFARRAGLDSRIRLGTEGGAPIRSSCSRETKEPRGLGSAPRYKEELLPVLHEDSEVNRIRAGEIGDTADVRVAVSDDIGESPQDTYECSAELGM